jgi:adenylyltransferase/sulfurtransferase
MPTLRIPTPLRSYTGGLNQIAVQGGTVSEAMQDLVAQYPALKQHLYNGSGELRPFVNLFIGEENVKDLQGLQTPLDEEDRLLLIPSIAGGSSLLANRRAKQHL